MGLEMAHAHIHETTSRLNCSHVNGSAAGRPPRLPLNGGSLMVPSRPPMTRPAPSSQRVMANGLPLHVLLWEGDPAHTLLLHHGWMDTAGSFLPLVAHLPPDWRVVAFDARGHGRSAPVGDGGYYHFADYVRDLSDVADALAPGPFDLLGHSMGGGVASLYAGTWPDRVRRLVVIEGLGPAAEDLADGPARMRRWIGEVRRTDRKLRPVGTLEEVVQKLHAAHPGVPLETLRTIAPWHVVGEAPHLCWAMDPLHRTRAPTIFRPEIASAFHDAVTASVLLLEGGQSWYRWEDLPARNARLRPALCEPWEDAGHMIHLEQPERLAALLVRFLGP